MFERSSGEISITRIGEQVIAQAQRTLEQAEAVKQTAQQGRDQLSGPLKVGAIYTIGPYIFPSLIPDITASAPDMPLIIEENYTAILAEKLKHGQLDVILISLPFDEPGIATLPVYEEPFVVLLPSAHPLCESDTIGDSELGAENVLLLGEGHCFRKQILAARPSCAPKHNDELTTQPSADGSSLETIRHMVVSGLGITVLPCTAAGADRYSQRLLKIKRFNNPIPTRTVALAWRKSFPRPRAINVLSEAILNSNPGCTEPL